MRRMSRMNRRDFITVAGAAGMGLDGQVFAGNSVSSSAQRPGKAMTPAEDLMFEHGIIERLLLIYERLCDRIDAGAQVPALLLFNAASIVRSFVEEFHEPLEEQHVFPRLERVHRHGDLVRTLRAQHAAGREVTTCLLDSTTGGALTQPLRTAEAMRAYRCMYLPHIFRENSVVLREFCRMVSPEEYRELGEQFGEKEHEMFGEAGFDQIVSQVEDMEKRLSIHHLGQFTVEADT